MRTRAAAEASARAGGLGRSGIVSPTGTIHPRPTLAPMLGWGWNFPVGVENPDRPSGPDGSESVFAGGVAGGLFVRRGFRGAEDAAQHVHLRLVRLGAQNETAQARQNRRTIRMLRQPYLPQSRPRMTHQARQMLLARRSPNPPNPRSIPPPPPLPPFHPTPPAARGATHSRQPAPPGPNSARNNPGSPESQPCSGTARHPRLTSRCARRQTKKPPPRRAESAAPPRPPPRTPTAARPRPTAAAP